jgi:hypothetical protein
VAFFSFPRLGCVVNTPVDHLRFDNGKRAASGSPEVFQIHVRGNLALLRECHQGLRLRALVRTTRRVPIRIETALVLAAEMLLTVFGGVTLPGVVRNVAENLRSLE